MLPGRVEGGEEGGRLGVGGEVDVVEAGLNGCEADEEEEETDDAEDEVEDNRSLSDNVEHRTAACWLSPAMAIATLPALTGGLLPALCLCP